jgi:hypothetical protein
MLTVLTVSSALVLIVMILRPGPAFTLQRDLDAQPSGEKSAAAVRTDCSRYEREHLIHGTQVNGARQKTISVTSGFCNNSRSFHAIGRHRHAYVRLPPVKTGVSP